MRIYLWWIVIPLLLWAVILAAAFAVWQIVPVRENVARWRFDALVQKAEARTQPCLRTTGPACPRPEPLVPNYCPFPVGGTP